MAPQLRSHRSSCDLPELCAQLRSNDGPCDRGNHGVADASNLLRLVAGEDVRVGEALCSCELAGLQHAHAQVDDGVRVAVDAQRWLTETMRREPFSDTVCDVLSDAGYAERVMIARRDRTKRPVQVMPNNAAVVLRDPRVG